jgi:hypothetical protein
MTTCTEPGPHSSGERLRRGLCSRHYYHLQLAGLPKLQRPTDADRFWAKVVEIDGCWVWQSTRFDNGYGGFTVGKRLVRAHRFAYEQMVGEIPDGLQLDHLCRNRLCVNPDHLDPVTPRVNTRRSTSLAAINSRKTHCPKGHPYDDVNTRFERDGRRTCRTCRNAECRAYYHKHKKSAVA